MSDFYIQFERNDNEVVANINSNLGTCQPVYSFSFNCNQETAELLTRHFESELQKHYTEIAKNPFYYLEPEQLSKLKMDLVKKWDAKNHCWK